ncbi:MAG: hypothetical protein R3185_05185, partial [Candidatus Thermoplasmatota archaeon]|nr:hypothetical protein [Candidatus Thermoplasmatota archaeon]
MAQILSVALMNQPGAMARVATELAAAGLNIEAFVGDTQAEVGVVRLLVDDPEKGLAILQKAGHPVQTIPGVKVDMANKPGELAQCLRELGKAGINVELIFGSTGGA